MLTEGPVKRRLPHSARSLHSVNRSSSFLLTTQLFSFSVSEFSRSQTISAPLSPLTHCPFKSMYTSMSNVPVAWILRYEAGIDWRRVEEGVTGDRKDRTISTWSDVEL